MLRTDLPYALWSRAAVRALIAHRCGVEPAVRTVGKYLARWGFTAQKPSRRAFEQDPAAGRRWLRREYPAIVARARQARGIVVWGDETGLRSDDVRGRRHALRGRTPVVRVCHRRAGLSLISAVTNQGKLRWMIVDGAVNAPTFIRFLRRLIREARCKVFLILDRLTVRRARLTRDWLAEHSSEIEVHHLPSYSPELNPDEGVHADLKQAVPGKAPARSKQQLKRAAISHMHSLSKRPQRIRAIFRHPQFRYAA
jgi:DDE superfamily endonuclease/Winged helix-turn helix